MLDVTRTPMSSTNILSRPTGPRELLTMLAIAAAAMTAKIREVYEVMRLKRILLPCLYSVILFSVVHSNLTTPSDHDSVSFTH